MIKSRYVSFNEFYSEFITYHSISFSVLKDKFKPGYRYFIDLEILLVTCLILKISFVEFQKHVIAYKTRRGNNSISIPIFPIKITPVFDMLLAHHFADGCLLNAYGNRKDYFLYRQYDAHYRNLYIKKIESIFGRIFYKSDYITNLKMTKIYAPIVISELLYSYYGLDKRSFISETARIPKQIFEKDWKNKLAFLIAFIIDEGHVDSNLIVIRIKNMGLTNDLSYLCNDLGYSHSVRIENNGYACLYILSSSLSKFYKDYLVLKEEYPVVDLGWKGLKIKEFIDRQSKPKIYRPGNKRVILQLLVNEQLTVNELASRLNMTRQGARYFIHKLEKENKIEVKSIVKFANWKYGVKNASGSGG